MPGKKNSNTDPFRIVMDSLDAVVYVADMETYEVLFVNKCGRDIWGDVVGKLCWQVLQSGQSEPCSFCTNHRLLDKNGEPTGVYQWEFQNSVDLQWYACRDQAIPWSDGRLVRIEIATNITQQKEGQEALRQSEERLRVTADQINGILYVVDKELRFTVSRGKKLALLGLEPNQAVGMSMYDFLQTTDPDHSLIALHRKVLAGEVVEYESSRAGRILSTVISPMMGQHGEVIGAVGLALDITERKQAEDELRISEEKYRSVFNVASPSLIVVEKSGEIVDINPYHLKHISKGKASKDDFLRKNILVHPSVANAGLVKAYQRVLEGATFEKDDVYFPETTGERARYFNVRGVPLLKDGEVVGAVFSLHDVTERVETEEKLRRQAVTDPLTGIFNRRHFFSLAEKELKRSKRYGHPLSVIIFDIDHFKRVNDLYGHTIGDKALCKLTAESQAGLRETDIFARYGGEEFIILLPETDLEQARLMAERIRRMCAGTAPLEVGSAFVSLTVSFGVACLDGENLSLDDLILRADSALYESKEAGRNRVTVWQPTAEA